MSHIYLYMYDFSNVRDGCKDSSGMKALNVHNTLRARWSFEWLSARSLFHTRLVLSIFVYTPLLVIVLSFVMRADTSLWIWYFPGNTSTGGIWFVSRFTTFVRILLHVELYEFSPSSSLSDVPRFIIRSYEYGKAIATSRVWDTDAQIVFCGNERIRCANRHWIYTGSQLDSL